MPRMQQLHWFSAFCLNFLCIISQYELASIAAPDLCALWAQLTVQIRAHPDMYNLLLPPFHFYTLCIVCKKNIFNQILLNIHKFNMLYTTKTYTSSRLPIAFCIFPLKQMYYFTKLIQTFTLLHISFYQYPSYYSKIKK